MTFHNRTRALTTLVFVLLLIMGCQQPADISPSPGLGDPYPAPPNDPQISVLAPDLQPWLGFHVATVIDDGERPMQVQVPVRNLSNHKYLIDYRILFYDANGTELEPQMGWKMMALLPKETVRLSGKALSTDAKNYRLEVKWGR
ncbi:MAG: YcfL family protein [Phycisphaerales bacterium]|nr:MAG: YcfL family protein [Phycisphaerales bacterium]